VPEVPLAPLVPELPLAPLVPELPLAPLVPEELEDPPDMNSLTTPLLLRISKFCFSSLNKILEPLGSIGGNASPFFILNIKSLAIFIVF
jgi:hypothetical protein